MEYAMAIPIPADKTEAFRRFFAETMGPRREGFDDFQRRQGVRNERYYLQTGPDGDVFIIVGEGDLKPVAEIFDSTHPFDRWFREQNQSILGYDVAQIGAELSERMGEWSI